MKSNILITFFLLISGLFFTRCESERNNGNLTIRLLNNPECKSNLKSITGNQITPDTLSCIEYAYDNASNKLNIIHINAGFNCCPGEIYAQVSLKNDTLLIEEFESSPLCDCNCLFDLELEINDVEADEYQIKLIEPYSGDQEPIIFSVDLLSYPEGSYCVTRKQYPWGISSLIE